MTCHPYNLNRTRRAGDVSPLILRAGLLVGMLSVVMLWGAAAQAQCDCGPVFGPPPMTPYALMPMPTYVIGQPYVQVEPVWPSSVQEEGESITTAYPPGVTLVDASSLLQQVPGQLRIIVPEAFLNRLLSRKDSDAGPVSDFILGASVSGNQSTNTCLTVDLQPSTQTARLLFELTGTTVNQTIGVTPQAAVRSRGDHQFRVSKQVDFDGLKFTTRSPAAWVTPQLTNEGAATPLTGVPLIGPLASQIALTEAERRRPAAEQVVTQRVTEQVAPRFNSEVDQQLAAANVPLQNVVPQFLARAGLTLSDLCLSSSKDHLSFGLRVPVKSVKSSQVPQPFHQQTDRPVLPAPKRPEEAAPPSDDGLIIIREISDEAAPAENVLSRRLPPSQPLPPPSLTEGASFTIALHEDLVNYFLNRATLGGAEVPDRTIDRLLKHLGELLSGTPLSQISLEDLGEEDPEFATIVLSEEDPLSVRFANGELLIEATAAFRPLLTPAVPAQRVQIPFTLTHNEGRLRLEPGEVTVNSLPGQAGGPMVELARPIIRQQVTQRLKPVEIPTSIPLTLTGLPPLSLTVREVTLTDGWLLIAVD